MSDHQESFDFDQPADESGYENYRAGLEAQKREIESEFGLIIGKNVRLKLRQSSQEMEGIIHYHIRNEKVILHMRSLEFAPEDVLSIVKL